jgi:hypothetical protein
MKTVWPLSSHPAAFLFLPGLVLTCVFAILQGVKIDASGYWVGVVSSATVFTVFSCTIPALAGAWSGSRLRRARVFDQTPARTSPHIAWVSLWPSFTLGMILQTIGTLIAASGTWGSPGRVPWEVLLAWAAMIAFHTVLGYAIGLYLPAVAATPVALVVSYVWLGFTWSASYVPLRYLSGLVISGCCTAYAELAWEAPLAVTLFSLAGIASIILVLPSFAPRHTKVVRAIAALATVSAVTSVSLTLAGSLGPYPSPPRSAADLRCEQSGSTTVCLFPEQVWRAETDAVKLIADALSQLEDEGIRVPTRVTAALLDRAGNSVSLVYRRDFPASTTIASLMSSLTPQLREGQDCRRDAEDPITAYLTREATAAALIALATHQTAYLDTIDPEVAPISLEILGWDSSTRAAWINETIDLLADCTRALKTLPGRIK